MKKLNLSTAFINMYTTLIDMENTTPTDYAVASAVLYGWNSKAWQAGFTTTISFLAWQTGSKPCNVRNSLKRLLKSQLLNLTPMVQDEKQTQVGTVKLQNKTKIHLTLGAKFDDYKVLNAIQYNQQYNNKQLTLFKSSKE